MINFNQKWKTHFEKYGQPSQYQDMGCSPFCENEDMDDFINDLLEEIRSLKQRVATLEEKDA